MTSAKTLHSHRARAGAAGALRAELDRRCHKFAERDGDLVALGGA